MSPPPATSSSQLAKTKSPKDNLQLFQVKQQELHVTMLSWDRFLEWTESLHQPREKGRSSCQKFPATHSCSFQRQLLAQGIHRKLRIRTIIQGVFCLLMNFICTVINFWAPMLITSSYISRIPHAYTLTPSYSYNTGVATTQQNATLLHITNLLNVALIIPYLNWHF